MFVVPGLYLNILKTEKILQFWDKTILDVRGKRLKPGVTMQRFYSPSVFEYFLGRLERWLHVGNNYVWFIRAVAVEVVRVTVQFYCFKDTYIFVKIM